MSSHSRSHRGAAVVSVGTRAPVTVRLRASRAAGTRIIARAKAKPESAANRPQPIAAVEVTLMSTKWTAAKANTSPAAAPASPITTASTADFDIVSARPAPLMRSRACSRIRRARPAPAIDAVIRAASTTPGAPKKRNSTFA